MKASRAIFALVSLAVLVSCESAPKSVESLFPAKQENYLTDLANVVKNSDAVNARFKEIREKDRLNLAVVTMPTTEQYEPSDVALAIGRKWLVATKNDTIGAAVRNTGGVILLVMDTHKCWISTATGSEGYMNDARAGDLCRNAASEFKADRFGEGILYIANAFDKYHRGEVPGAMDLPPSQDIPTWVIFAIIVIVILIFLAIGGIGYSGGDGDYSSGGGGFFSGGSSGGGGGGFSSGGSGSFSGGGGGGGW